MKVLVVEDDAGLSDVLAKVLTAHQYQVELADDGESGMALVEAFDYDLVLLDLHLPKLDGIRFCQRLRTAGGDVPILLMTAEDTTASKIAGLDAGADDYVTKPLDTGELLARVRALLRRGRAETSPILSWGLVSLDPSSCEVWCYDDEPLKLTGKEYGLLELFLRNQHRIFSLGALTERLWTAEKNPSENAIRTHMKGLRRKLKQGGIEGMIETVYGLGYRLGAEPAGDTAVKSRSVEVTDDATGNQHQDATAVKTAQPSTQDRLQEIWLRHRPKYLDLITHLEKVVAVGNERRDELTATVATDRAVIEKSQQAVHTLKGTLGSFGFVSSSQLAAQIEPFLSKAPQLSSSQVHQLSNLIRALRQSLSLSTAEPVECKSVSDVDVSTDCVENSPLQPSSLAHSAIAQAYQWLIVDSDQVLTEALIRKASVLNIQARVVTTLEAAQQALAQQSPSLIMLDPDCATSLEDGLDFLRSLSQTHPQLHVIVASAQDTLSDRVKILRSSGGCTFLQKPTAPSQILETVNHRLMRPAILEPKIIALDDDPLVLQCLDQLLSPWGFQLTLLSNPAHFWRALEQTSPDLLILDIEMPELNGLELCEVIRSDPQLSQIPILFLTAHTDPEIVRQVFEAGGDDYVSKPMVGSELVSRILNRLKRLQLLRRLADTDSLTGLSCRRQSVIAINHLLKLAARQEQTLCLALLDLDRFKQVNDIYGHEMGDHVIKTFGDYLRQAFRGEDVVARWGGEEFVVGLYASSKAMAVQRLSAVLAVFSQHTFTGNVMTTRSQQPFQVGFSAGIAAYPADGDYLQTLYRNADRALYQAKKSGRGKVLPALNTDRNIEAS